MNILKAVKKFLNRRSKNKSNNMRRRRESVVTVYKKTTKFLTTNTSNLLKKMPNKKHRLLTKLIEEVEDKKDVTKPVVASDEEDDLGERDLDYYLGVRNKESFWRDPASKEQIRKDFLLYHCGVTEDDYEQNYKISAPKVSSVVQTKRKQVPFKIHRKRKIAGVKDDSWREKSLFKLFAYKRESEYSDSSNSYSECESEEGDKESRGYRTPSSEEDEEGVRIKEVSEGRPCDNCPELCPGFIQHAWRQFELAEVYRKMTTDKPEKERRIQKFPSRERNYAVRRKNDNNNFRPHVNCLSCAMVAEREKNQNG